MRTKAVAVAGMLGAFIACAAWSLEGKKEGAISFPAGYRGVGIPIPASEIPFVKKGDYVDVLVTFDAQLKDAKEKLTATMLQHVLVADIKRLDKADEKGAIELVVNPNEAEYLALGLTQGELLIAVRAEGDKEMKPMEMASFRKILR